MLKPINYQKIHDEQHSLAIIEHVMNIKKAHLEMNIGNLMRTG